MRRGVVVAVAVVLALALALSGALALGLTFGGGGGSGSSSSAPSSEAAEPAAPSGGADPTEPPDPALAGFYAQDLSWEDCPDAAGTECATLRVPVDYAEPDGDTLELALLRVPARGDAVASMVVNPGGPGAPGTDYAAVATRVFNRPLTASLDVVGFDPRGTGESAPVDCLTDEQLDAYLAADPDPDTPEEGEAFEDAQEDFFDGCVERSGEVVGHVTTIEAARDMDVLRAALGDPVLTYFGASYGTKLGATYAELFPDRVGRLVLDGAVDVSLPSRELSLQQAAGFERALRSYVTNCVENISGCYLGDSVDGGLARIVDLLDSLEDQPLPTGEDRDLTRGLAFYGAVFPLYNRDYWPLLDQAMRAALDGDGSALLLLSDLYHSREAGTYTNNSSEAILAINCLDDPYAITADEVPDQFDDFEQASPTFGEVFAWGLVGCDGIEVTSSEPALDIRGEGAAPILVVGTTRDPATPYEWAQALADQLDSGVLLTRDGDGHTGYNAGNACVDRTIEAYLLEGTVPEDGTRC